MYDTASSDLIEQVRFAIFYFIANMTIARLGLSRQYAYAIGWFRGSVEAEKVIFLLAFRKGLRP